MKLRVKDVKLLIRTVYRQQSEIFLIKNLIKLNSFIS